MNFVVAGLTNRLKILGCFVPKILIVYMVCDRSPIFAVMDLTLILGIPEAFRTPFFPFPSRIIFSFIDHYY